MADITLKQVQEITSAAKSSLEMRFPYKESYEKFNDIIVSTSREGINSVTFDFVYRPEEPEKHLTLLEIERGTYRIYLQKEGGQAEIDVYDYPLYLLTKGFKVEILDKSMKSRHGYLTKQYLISW